jgi:phosphate starvation-inducible protein PhoH
MEAFLNRNNVEEEKVFKTITINVKCKTENQKKLVESIKKMKLLFVVDYQDLVKHFYHVLKL